LGRQTGGEFKLRVRLTELEGLFEEQKNPELWPSVDESELKELEKEIFLRRKTAVMMYFKREGTTEIIKEATLIGRQELSRLIKRCMSLDENGVVWGFRGLIPNKKVKQYKLNLVEEKRNESRKSGEFMLLLEKHPDLMDLIDDLYLGRNKRSLEPAMKPKYIHKKLIDACREKGIPHSEYPFSTKWMGFRALQRYLRRLGYLHFNAAVSRNGEDALQKARNAGEGEQNHPSVLMPYQRVQFDGHRIDGRFVVKVVTPEGDVVTVVLDRFWILTLIDVATRNIIGYAISLSKEYSASDVMRCVRNAVLPKEKMKLSIEGLYYHEIGGFPSNVYPDVTTWAVWDVLCFDNAKAHLANLVRDRLKHLIGCATNLGPVALPMRRGLIERFFKILEESGFHRLPNTTGSNPDDPRRTTPEKNAVKWNISYEHLKELVDVLISNYNGTPHGGIYHQSPLELLEKRMSSGLLPRRLEEGKRSEMLFLQTSITRTVRGSITSGRRPYIQYEGEEYRSEKLSNSAHLINRELKIHVNVDDIRTIKAFLPDGSEFGYLTVAGKWSLTAHSLETRRAINSLVHRKLLHFTNNDDPIFVYTDYLMKNANKGGKKGTFNKITKVNEAASNNITPVNAPEEYTQALEKAQAQEIALDKVRAMNQIQQQEIEITHYEKMLSKLKTKYI
jgi:putative transposase